MAELLERLRGKVPTTPLLLFSAALLLLCFSIILALFANRDRPEPEPSAAAETPLSEPSPAPSEPEQPALLVTAEQMSRLSYTDSLLGPLSWNLSQESLEELNQILIGYGILDSQEICHFLAQATVETGAVAPGGSAPEQRWGWGQTGTFSRAYTGCPRWRRCRGRIRR